MVLDENMLRLAANSQIDDIESDAIAAGLIKGIIRTKSSSRHRETTELTEQVVVSKMREDLGSPSFGKKGARQPLVPMIK